MTPNCLVSAVILAGGRGTRLQAVVADRPKPLAPVAGRPFLTYLLDQLVDAGVERVVLSTGYLAEQFADTIGGRYRNLEMNYAREASPLGTGGAIKFASQRLTSSHILVLNGDSYCNADLSAYVEWHCAGDHDVSMLLVKVDDASRYGTVQVGDDQRILAFREKSAEPTAGYINAGIYLLRAEMMDELPDGPSSIERDVFPIWLGKYCVRGWISDGEFIDIGIPSDYARSHEFMKRVSP